MKKNIETKISAVTVYNNQASVTRQNTVQLTGEERELVISRLPTTVQTDSVRVAGAGTVAVRIVAVRTESIFAPEPTVENIAQIDEQIKALESQKRTLSNRLASIQLQLNFVENLSENSKKHFSIGLAKQQVSLDETKALLDFVGQQYRDYVEEIAELEKQQQVLDNQISAQKKQRQKLQTPKNNESLSIIITIEPDGAGEFELEVSYMANRASWIPLYDLQVDTTSASLNLSYLAQVKQSTGEDWSDVVLTLSTAKPGVGSLPPKLKPWYIDLPRPASPPAFESAAPPMRRYSAEKRSKRSASRASVLEEDAQLERVSAKVAVAQVSKAGSVVTFEVGGGGNIPSDGTPHKVTIFNDDYSFSLQYVAVPRLVSFPYLQATVINPPTGVTLLPGKANIFRDGAFVGTTQLNNITPGEEFELNLGIDEGIKIERDLVERQVDKKLIGNQRRITYAYRLVVTNLLDRENSLKLSEQLPVSRNEKLKVRLDRINPKIEQGEMGVLTWNLTLPPNSKREIYYQFFVDHPRELTVFGLDI